jgi:hypothetical protein
MLEIGDSPKMPSAFHLFVNEKWFEHKDEILLWTGKPLTEYGSDYYFNKHKWLLKRMFKDEKARTKTSST